MPMRRELYPENWEAIALRVKELARWQCEECGVVCKPAAHAKLTLTVAHLDHDPGNCCITNLRALCVPCHLRYDNAERKRIRDIEKRLDGLESQLEGDASRFRKEVYGRLLEVEQQVRGDGGAEAESPPGEDTWNGREC